MHVTNDLFINSEGLGINNNMTVTDSVYEILVKEGPLISGEIQKKLMNNLGLKREASRKRIERSCKLGYVEKYINISNKGYLYYIKDLHDKYLLKIVSLKYLKNNNCRLYNIIDILNENIIISVEEICRLYNIRCKYNRYYSHKHKKMITSYDVKLNSIILNLIKLGYIYHKKYIIHNLDNQKITSIINEYENKMKDEYIVLSFAIKFLKDNGVNVEFSNYRTNRESSLYSKFDALGKAGFKKIVSLLVECQTRRKVVISDLLGHKNRRGSSIKRNIITKPIISYFVSREFSGKCLKYAKSNHIRLLIWKGGINFIELQPDYIGKNNLKTIRGRYSNLRGDAFELYIHNAYQIKYMNVQMKKKIYIDKDGKLNEKDTGTTYTDIDVYVVDNNKALLIECKSSKRKLLRKYILTIVRKYNEVANYLKQEYKFESIAMIIICNYNELDAIDAIKISKIPIEIINPKNYYYQNRKLLKGVPKWLFVEEGEEEIIYI